MREYAYAKVNLFLNVKGTLDNGYHDLEMINIMVGLRDEIDYEKTDGEIICETSDKNLNGKNNLAYKVAIYLKKVFQVKEGVRIYIKKNIPIGGGLGGGSSDAATTIEALNKLWNLNLDFDEMFEISKNFGSDTAYCLFKGPAIVRGIGYDIEPIDLDISDYEISLFSPKINVSTGTVFNNLINNNKYPLDEYLKYFKEKDFSMFVKGLKNDLEDTVFNLYPEVKNKYDFLKSTYKDAGIFMTGSGSTIVKIVKKIR